MRASLLLQEYNRWRAGRDETAASATALASALKEAGYTKDRRADGMYYRGLTLANEVR